MDVAKLNELGEDLMRLLRCRTYPVGINLFEKEKDIPEYYEKTEQEFAVCHIIGKARYHEKPVAATKDFSKACAVGGVVLGFGKFADNWADVNVGRFSERKEGVEKARKLIFPFEYGKYEAFGAAPLNIIKIVPDVIQIFANPLQVMEMIYGNTFNGDDNIQLSTNGHGASCYEALVSPIVTGNIRLAIADMGDRRYGYASDDELILGVPTNKFERLIDGLKKNMKTWNGLPIKYTFQEIPKSVKAVMKGK